MPPAPLPTIPTDWATILSRIFSHTTFAPSDDPRDPAFNRIKDYPNILLHRRQNAYPVASN